MINIDSIELTVDVVVGSVKLGIDKIKSLTPGQNICTLRQLGFVKLMVNNATIGEGFLVEVSGKSAVRITKIYSSEFEKSCDSISNE